MSRPAYRLTELADAAGVTPRTVRYYIAQGLLESPGRLGPQTRYGDEHLERLRLIRGLQDERLSLGEIRRRLDGNAHGVAERAAVSLSIPTPAASSPAPTRARYERVVLAPGLELHLQRPLSGRTKEVAEHLIRYGRELLAEMAR